MSSTFTVPVEVDEKYVLWRVVRADDLDEARRISRATYWKVDGIREMDREDVTIKAPPAQGGTGGR